MPKAWVVFVGGRDYETNVAACATEELADQVLRAAGVREVPSTFYKGHTDIQDDDNCPWGIVEVELIEAESDIESALPAMREQRPFV